MIRSAGEPAYLTVSAFPTVARYIGNDAHILPYVSGSDYQRHCALLAASSSSFVSAVPLIYFRLNEGSHGVGSTASLNSADTSAATLAGAYYKMIDERLGTLADEARDNPDEAPVDAGAVETATNLISKLRDFQIVPPELTWHGGDAIVMLWALGTTSWAITVTAGEVGYTVRKDRKTVRYDHSIPLQRFELLEMNEGHGG